MQVTAPFQNDNLKFSERFQQKLPSFPTSFLYFCYVSIQAYVVVSDN